MNSKTGVLLINLGTPDSPSIMDVGRYLYEFLNDPRVIDLPAIARFFLVNFVIIPFRVRNSTKIYKKLWTAKGSPIIIYGKSVQEKLQQALGDDFGVELAMRYKDPSLDDVVKQMEKKNYGKIIILPLFPQYASASTGSAIDKAIKLISKWWIIPEIKIINQFYNDEGYLNTIIERAKKYNLDEYDHILFSYHGLPVRQVDKVYSDGTLCEEHNCETEINETNEYCYKATSYATTRLLADKLEISQDRYTVCFQSRLDKMWLEPFSDKVVIEQAKKSAKKLLVFSPAFVADCLETTIEIGEEYKQLFEENGGETLHLVESLNDHPMWIDALKDLVLKNTWY
jgi:ferrochelatase